MNFCTFLAVAAIGIVTIHQGNAFLDVTKGNSAAAYVKLIVDTNGDNDFDIKDDRKILSMANPVYMVEQTKLEEKHLQMVLAMLHNTYNRPTNMFKPELLLPALQKIYAKPILQLAFNAITLGQFHGEIYANKQEQPASNPCPTLVQRKEVQNFFDDLGRGRFGGWSPQAGSLAVSVIMQALGKSQFDLTEFNSKITADVLKEFLPSDIQH